jgi:hypothetical protein
MTRGRDALSLPGAGKGVNGLPLMAARYRQAKE